MVDTPAITLLISGIAVQEEWTVRKVLEWTRDYLRRGGVELARFEAEELLAHALKEERLSLYLEPERILTEEELARFRSLVTHRRRGVPLQYLLGEVEFMGFTLRVDGRALIPRPETEGLVELILREVNSEDKMEILELGTGSGAIAIALAKLLPSSQITAVDISPEALKLAEENVARNGVEEQIESLKSDWFTQVGGQFDLIVANPPYVGIEEIAGLPREVREHEPRAAWDGGEEGLEALQRIIMEAPAHLKPGGRLYLEIGAGQGAEVRKLAVATGTLAGVEILQDLGGRERYLRAERRV